MDLPNPVRSGEALRADWLNGLLAAMRAGQVSGGSGIEISASISGVVISLAAMLPDLLIPVRVFRDPPGPDPDWPSAVSYRVEGIYRGFVEAGVLPTYNRPVRGDEAKIHPQPDGSIALIIRAPDGEGSNTAELFMFGETVSITVCPGTAQ